MLELSGTVGRAHGTDDEGDRTDPGDTGRSRAGRVARGARGRARRLVSYGLAVLLAATSLTLADPGTPSAAARGSSHEPSAPLQGDGRDGDGPGFDQPGIGEPGGDENEALTAGGEATGTFEVHAAGPCAGRLMKRISFRTGELRVFQNQRYACAVTVAHKSGPRRPMRLSIQTLGARPVVDEGRYTRQAGPRTVYANGRCVRASGSVAGYGTSTGWILC
ncbi:hypothetical protein [Streptomyces sp. NPDC058953]|uniref:hypothetical protein n=1 Tax=unclassified Streptomyces TaxID=2593676 RepID=UPI0036C8C0CF